MFFPRRIFFPVCTLRNKKIHPSYFTEGPLYSDALVPIYIMPGKIPWRMFYVEEVIK